MGLITAAMLANFSGQVFQGLAYQNEKVARVAVTGYL
jgi:hypothetical protein